ncbi:hypothetical protein SASPL_154170 [Salvia splendens]|uniref:Nuclear/nucleolar GTPase 2 n=1 Tax=Salvia splendens TaxID=180675 RepID=A0A8X8YZL6_SALSN|nr:hypothetical protein SASPL_154170 [Salvia splendens]
MYNTRASRSTMASMICSRKNCRLRGLCLIVASSIGNTRVVGQKELEYFREELESRLASGYDVLIKGRKLPTYVPLERSSKVSTSLTHNLLLNTFGSKTKRKKPKLLASDYESLIRRAEILDAFGEKHGASTSTEGDGDGFRDVVRHTMLEKGQSKCIRGELYKVFDSSDVVIQCDLVPAWVTKGWLRVLSKEYPTLAFHASVNKPFGKGSLLAVLRQFSRFKSDKQAISVGYPNVGKSSVINTLRTKNGGEPDYTTAAKMILHDWQRGKIPIFVPPPKEEEQALDEAEVDAIADDKANR